MNSFVVGGAKKTLNLYSKIIQTVNETKFVTGKGIYRTYVVSCQ